jgi:CyaY protein
MIPEKDYRQFVDLFFKRLGDAFDAVDPDVAEFEYAQGSGTILFADGSRCILSVQPSVRQLWLAVAARGVAFHFNYDENSKHWIDDKGKGVELLSYLKDLVRDVTRVELRL